MKKNQQGIVLISTVVVLCLLQLIILSEMQLVYIQVKSLNNLIAKLRHEQLLEIIAQQLLSTNDINPNCVITENLVLTIAQLKEKNGCSNNTYHYLIEDLNESACLRFYEKNHLWSTHSWRLTITENQETYLQIRYLTPISLLPCLSRERVVKDKIVSINKLTID